MQYNCNSQIGSKCIYLYSFLIVISLSLICTRCKAPTKPDDLLKVVKIVNPIENSVVNDKITIIAELENIEEYKSVEIFIDNSKIHTFLGHNFEFEWNTRFSINGNHSIYGQCILLNDDIVKSEPLTINIQNLHNFQKQPISFQNHNNNELKGFLFKADSSELVVLTGHSFVQGEDQTGLFPFAEKLAEHGFTVMTFDFPGRGDSAGPTAYNEVYLDAQSAITYLLNNGYQRIACLGIGLGGLGCAKNALSFDGLITVSIPLFISGHPIITSIDMSKPYPKLFIASHDDFANNRPFAERAQNLYDMSVEPKQLMLFNGTYHSMELFRSQHKSKLEKTIIEFFLSLK